MSDRNITDLHPDMQVLCQKFLVACKAVGINVGISQTYRSSQEQDNDYQIGRVLPGKIITNAQGGESPHNCTLADGTPAAKAFDFYILDTDDNQCDWNPEDAQWRQAIAIGQNLGLVSGSTFNIKDNDHFELTNWKA
jgi:peptidoglycan L-alanyl-D-glutamate endopeptidase CwlK